jgi:serine/threonine protein phosphatase PrpC
MCEVYLEQTMRQGTEFQGDSDKEKAQNEALEVIIKGKHITLPNGKENQEYRSPFNIAELFPEIQEVRFVGLEDIGLTFQPETKEIFGIPTKAGDHKITMNCKRKDREEDKPLITREITLIINPNPRSLWQNIETPENSDYYKPDEDKAFVKATSPQTGASKGRGKKKQTPKNMVAASQRGRSHAHEGKARDDDFRLFFHESSQWYVMAVADGAGSAKYSRRGSQIACETVIEVCKEKIAELNKAFELQISEFQKNRSDENRKKTGDLLYKMIGAAVFQAYKNIEKEAMQGENKSIKDFSTTLLVSICKKFDFGWFIGTFWVGDGGIGIYNKETSFVKILGEPDSGEFAGQTRFLTMPEIMQPSEIYRRLRFELLDDFTALILMTDGITDPKFETDANLNKIEKWNDLWNDLNGANEDHIKVDFSGDNQQTADRLLQWLNFWSKGNHDDRTIAILF